MSLNVTGYPLSTTGQTVADPTRTTTTATTTDAMASAGNSASAGDQVSLSAQAQQLLAASKRGALIFDAVGATLGGKRVALTDIINSTDGTYTETERKAAVRQINQRETAGFRWAKPTTQDPVAMKQYYATYLSYLTKLPPEEQNSARYKGQTDVARKLMKEADRQIALSSVKQSNLSTYGNTDNLFGPFMARLSSKVSQQLAGLPATNLTSTARYFQQVISHTRSAEQVLATPEPKTSTTGSNTTATTGSTSTQA
ncbi:MAG TPA: hypothetical protein VF920_06125 [Dongiaceae bacterium]